MELLKYSCDKTELQQFHETMLTLYGINSIRSMLNEDPEVGSLCYRPRSLSVLPCCQ